MASSGMMSIAEMTMILDRDDAARDRGHGVRGPRVPSAGSMERSSTRCLGGLIIKQLERELVRVDFSVTLAQRRETLARAKKTPCKDVWPSLSHTGAAQEVAAKSLQNVGRARHVFELPGQRHRLVRGDQTKSAAGWKPRNVH